MVCREASVNSNDAEKDGDEEHEAEEDYVDRFHDEKKFRKDRKNKRLRDGLHKQRKPSLNIN